MSNRKIMFRVILLGMIFSLPADASWAAIETNYEKAGDILQIALPMAACGTTFIIGDHEGSVQFFKSFLTCFGVTQGLKYAINKPRPKNNGNYSFPSGHTSITFQGAAFVLRRYGLKPSIPFFLGASYVGWSRVGAGANKHDWWDVTAGAALGTLSSFIFTTKYEGVQVVPVADGEMIGFNVSCRW